MKYGLTTMALSAFLSLAPAHALAQAETGSLLDRQYRQDFKSAVELFEHGMFNEARMRFDALSRQKSTPEAEGYSVLCALSQRTPGCEDLMLDYLERNSSSSLCNALRFQHALNLFDDGEYAAAAEVFDSFDRNTLTKRQQTAYLFKRAYCAFEQHDYPLARYGFNLVAKSSDKDYAATSRYALGYINYEDNNFDEAIEWFGQSVKDPRFESISEYYLLECHFMRKDYDYVVEYGPGALEKIPEDRVPQAARILSETYFVLGDPVKANKYYKEYVIGEKPQNRSDLFYAGSLLYALKDWNGAIENYTQMSDRSDSLGQIANYQLAYSYIQTKNKVAAMECFRDASMVDFDPRIAEDAAFNHSKLAFDLNNDAAPFRSYMDRYSTTRRGESIYGYMALSELASQNWQGALDAYDKIDELDANMRGNYMKANYLRAQQLIGLGAWKSAVTPLKTAAYYSDKKGKFNQLSRFWLAESYFRQGEYDKARSLYTELYNASALQGMEEQQLIEYGLGFCNFKDGKYDVAVKWFDEYLGHKGGSFRKDAMERKGDCLFMQKDYDGARAAYGESISNYGNANDIYPYYQSALCCGFKNDRDGKAALLENVLKASPDARYYPDAVYELGRTYASLGSVNKAAECFEMLLTNVKDSTMMAKSLLELGTMKRNAHNDDEALGYYAMVVEQLPQSSQAEAALLAIESIYQAKGDPKGYIAYIEGIGKGETKTDSDRELMFFNAAEQAYLAGNYERALGSLLEYETEYPEGQMSVKADYYIAESCKELGQKERALEYYSKVVEAGESSFEEVSKLNFSEISYSLQRYDDALGGYASLYRSSAFASNRTLALKGMMRSAYRGKRYDEAISNAALVKADPANDAAVRREADYVIAKSHMATSHRDEAMAMFKSLAADLKSAEGAEAAYILIQDACDRGDFESVEEQTYAFSDSGSGQMYWLAKSFISLGDSFAERGNMAQAKATFESILEGYSPKAGGDDVEDAVRMRLDRIEKMSKK